MDTRKAMLLEIKRKAGLATEGEIAALERMPVVCGNGLVVPRPAASLDAWLTQFQNVTVAGYATPEESDADDCEPAAPEVTHDGDLMLCEPAAEPSHADKPRTHRRRILGRE